MARFDNSSSFDPFAKMSDMYFNQKRRFLKRWAGLLFSLIVFVPLVKAGNPIVEINRKKGSYSLIGYLEVFEDRTGELSFSEITQPSTQQKFSKISSDTPSFGYTKSAIWVRFQIYNASSDNREILLVTKNPGLDQITLFFPNEKGAFLARQGGDAIPFTEREYKHRNIIFPLVLKGKESYSCYLRLQSSGAMQSQLSLWHTQSFAEDDYQNQMVIGIFIGILAVMMFYNLFIYFSVRDKPYLFYVIYIFVFLLAFLTAQGFSFQYFWPQFPVFQKWVNGFYCMSLATGTLFTVSFLDTKNHSPKIHISLIILIGVGYTVALLTPFAPQSIIAKSTATLGGVNTLAVFSVTLVFVIWGHRNARLFLLAWTSILLGALAYVLTLSGILPANFLTLNFFKIGSALEIILFSLALADRINRLKRERAIARNKALEAQKKALEAQRILNEELEKKVAERTEELTIANETKDKFFSIIAHDLRGPVGSLSVALQDLIKPDKPVEKELLKVLRFAADNTYALLENLLTWARGQKGELEIKPTVFTTSSIIEQTMSVLYSLAREKEIDLRFEDSTNAFVYADPAMTQTVVRNLISNAIKFTPANGKISVSCQIDDNMERIEVVDNGTGMSEDQLSKIFTIGGKDVSSPGTNNETGTGLGLVLCKDFVELNGGQIGVDSKLDEGSRFWFTLPLSNASETAIHKGLDQFYRYIKGMNVLLVDDNILNHKTSANTLQELDITFHSVYNGTQALKMIEDHRYDLIFMDIDMPEMNGIDATRAIRRDLVPAPPVIALTSYSKTELLLKSRDTEFEGYLHKPLIKEELEAVLFNILKEKMEESHFHAGQPQ